jgi:hypothetical protein
VANVGKKCIRGSCQRTRGKRTLEGPRVRWEDNIKLGLKGTECCGANWIHVAQNREKRRVVVNTAI